MRSTGLLVFVLFAAAAPAQMDPLEADRPDQTESPAIVPGGWFQLESGWVRETATDGGGSTALPALLAKVGLCERVELRLVAERVEERPLDGDPGVRGFLPVEVGAKFALCKEQGARPRTSVIAHAGIPGWADKDLRATSAFGNMRFTMQHTLSSRFSLGYNLGAEWSDDTFRITGLYTLTIGAALGERLACFGELYGFVADDAPADHRSDAGITYRLGPDVLLDASGGVSLNGSGTWFIGAGVSFRLPVWGSR